MSFLQLYLGLHMIFQKNAAFSDKRGTSKANIFDKCDYSIYDHCNYVYEIKNIFIALMGSQYCALTRGTDLIPYECLLSGPCMHK